MSVTEACNYIDRRFAAYVDLLRELVNCQSTLGNVRGAQEIIYRQLRQMGGIATMRGLDLQSLSVHPDYAPVNHHYSNQPNVIARFGNVDTDDPPFVLNGHVDVVGPGPIDWWTYHPWAGELHDGRMYGRGALDMKSGLVAGLMAIDALMNSGIDLLKPIVFESVIEEECTGNGMLDARLLTPSTSGAIVLEPTNMTSWTATTGVIWFQLQITGKPAYVGRSSDYVNAVETASELIVRLKPGMVKELNEGFDHPAFQEFCSPLTMNVGVIEGGEWPSNVPLECHFTCRMSYPIDWSLEEVKGFINRHISQACSNHYWLSRNPPMVTFPGFRAKGWETSIDTPLQNVLADSHKRISGEPLSFTAFPGTADARYFSSDQQVAYYGPIGGNIHSPDEYVEVESIRNVSKVLVEVISSVMDGA